MGTLNYHYRSMYVYVETGKKRGVLVWQRFKV